MIHVCTELRIGSGVPQVPQMLAVTIPIVQMEKLRPSITHQEVVQL